MPTSLAEVQEQEVIVPLNKRGLTELALKLVELGHMDPNGLTVWAVQTRNLAFRISNKSKKPKPKAQKKVKQSEPQPVNKRVEARDACLSLSETYNTHFKNKYKTYDKLFKFRKADLEGVLDVVAEIQSQYYEGCKIYKDNKKNIDNNVEVQIGNAPFVAKTNTKRKEVLKHLIPGLDNYQAGQLVSFTTAACGGKIAKRIAEVSANEEERKAALETAANKLQGLNTYLDKQREKQTLLMSMTGEAVEDDAENPTGKQE